MPRVFERARGHFLAFTHHGYELRLGRDAEAPRLFAVDLRTSEGRDLGELSDGTRAQLLLAARMAFAEEVERGERFPCSSTKRSIRATLPGSRRSRAPSAVSRTTRDVRFST